uniref:Neur_chan_LBD domain-containing protein n=1 Tax=Strongyloides papillosus TaxID=174720 RepID=A0A0N5CCM2_STREA
MELFQLFINIFIFINLTNCIRKVKNKNTLGLWKSIDNPGVHNQNVNISNVYLIRNVTRILNTILLKQDKNFRPTNGEKDKPLTVEVDILVISIGPISEHDLLFSCDCYFRQRWLDDRLAFTPITGQSEMSLASKFLEEIWQPDTYIKNGQKSYLHTLTVPNVLLRVRSDGQVTVSQRLTIRSKCKMFFSKFPHDSQLCHIEIGSLGYFDNEVTYIWKKVELDKSMSNMLSQYKLTGHYIETTNLSDPRYDNKKYTVLKAYFGFKRQQGFYILQIYTPSSLIVIMSWVSFWINKEASPARVALGVMAVLSISTIGFTSRNDLPKVSYPTALDIYMITCFGFVFAALVEYAVINYAQIAYIKKKLEELKGLENQKMIRQMFASSIMTAERASFDIIQDDIPMKVENEQISLWRKLLCRGKEEQKTSVFYRMAIKATKAKEKLKNHDPAEVVNKIDYVSKIIFPLAYVAFNLLYWCSFLFWIKDEVELLEV